MIRNPTLEDIRSSIHSRPIPWKGLNRANVVSEDEVHSFESLGKLNGAERAEQVQASAHEYSELLVNLLSKDIRDDLVKYVLLFIVEHASTAPAFANALAANRQTFPALTALLSRNDEQISLLAAVSISALASTTTNVAADPGSIEALFKYTIQNLLLTTKSDVNYKDLGAQILVRVLQDPRYRTVFLPLEVEAVPTVLALVASAPLQCQYTGLLVLWVLSFDKPSATRFITEFSVVPVVLDVVKAALKEKITRVGVALLANLVRFVPKTSVPVLIAEGALSTARQLESRKIGDEELKEDLQYVVTSLTDAYEKMTTFEEYKNELDARRLRWTPVHKNKAFWIENIDEFKQRDWQPLKQLLELVNSSTDTVTLAVACHDISAIVGEAPEAAQVITRFGAKVRLMELIANDDAEVRYEALRATQKMISHILV